MKKGFFIGILICGGFSLQAEKNDIPDRVQKASQALAFTEFKLIDAQRGRYFIGNGSGFFVNDTKTFVTNFHVVQTLLTSRQQELNPRHFIHALKIKHDGKIYPVKGVKNISVLHDLIILEVEGYEGEFLKLSDKTPSGNLYVMGFPHRTLSVIPANVSYFRDEDTHYFLYPRFTIGENLGGISGGPVVNSDGEVVGIFSSSTTWIFHIIKIQILKQLLEEAPKPLSNNVIHRIQDQIQLIYNAAEMGDPIAYETLWLLSDNFTINALKKIKDLKNKSDLKKFQNDEVWRWREKSAKLGNPPAMYVLGGLYITKGYPKLGFEWMKKAALIDYPYAQYILYLLYKEGIGTKQSIDEAFKWLQKAALHNHTRAMFDLGVEYMKKWWVQGTPFDKRSALSWFQKAAERGSVQTQFTLALMYLTGSGLVQDIKTALEYLRLAAQASHEPSQFLLGILYKTGTVKGINQNEERGRYWLKESIREREKRFGWFRNLEGKRVSSKYLYSIYAFNQCINDFKKDKYAAKMCTKQNLGDLEFIHWVHSKKFTEPLYLLDLIEMIQKMEPQI